jgi:hypothetical protein
MALVRALLLLALVTPASADRAFVGMHDAFVVFDGKVAKRPFKSPRFALQIAQVSADVLWIGSTLTVHRWNAGKLDVKAFVTAQHMRIAKGVMWLGNQKELVWFDGQWNDLELPRQDAEILKDLEIDDTGRVWILLGNRLLYTNGHKWTTFVGPTDQDARLCKLAARGDLFMACGEVVYRLASNTWTKVMMHASTVVDDLHVAADGAIYVVGWKQLFVKRASGDLVADLPPWTLAGFAVDTRGRMWFAHGNGLTVLDAQGKKLRLPRALATTDPVRAVLVEGAGPKL